MKSLQILYCVLSLFTHSFLCAHRTHAHTHTHMNKFSLSINLAKMFNSYICWFFTATCSDLTSLNRCFLLHWDRVFSLLHTNNVEIIYFICNQIIYRHYVHASAYVCLCIFSFVYITQPFTECFNVKLQKIDVRWIHRFPISFAFSLGLHCYGW